MRVVNWFVGRVRGLKKVRLGRKLSLYGFGFFVFAFIMIITIGTHTPHAFLLGIACFAICLVWFPLAFLFTDVEFIEKREKAEEDRKQEFINNQDKVIEDLSDWYAKNLCITLEYRPEFTLEAKNKLITKIISKLENI